jgi:hypothetical protein
MPKGEFGHESMYDAVRRMNTQPPQSDCLPCVDDDEKTAEQLVTNMDIR